jgi:Helix-turn-helix domain
MCVHGVNRRLANGFRGRRRPPASGNDSAQICRSRALCEYAERARTRAQIICARTSSRRAVALSTERRIWRRWPACASPTDRRLGVASTETKPPQNVRPHPSRSAWNRWTHGRCRRAQRDGPGQAAGQLWERISGSASTLPTRHPRQRRWDGVGARGRARGQATGGEGTQLREIGRMLGCSRHAVTYTLRREPRPPRPAAWNPSPARLSLHEREEIRVGLERGDTLPAIAKGIGRAVSTVSREVKANGGRDAYRAHVAHQAAFERARRPKTPKLACPRLAGKVAGCRGKNVSPHHRHGRASSGTSADGAAVGDAGPRQCAESSRRRTETFGRC